MLSIEEFGEILDELSGGMPEDFFRELNGGVLLMEHAKLHPASARQDLWIMGEYSVSRSMGRAIYIYYGSFARVYGYLPEQALRRRVRKTLVHEFRHHLESLAGERDLEVEDAVALARYRRHLVEAAEHSNINPQQNF